MIRFFVLIDNIQGESGPTQAKLRELRVKEEKKKVAITNEQRRLTGSTELTSESNPRVCKFLLSYPC